MRPKDTQFTLSFLNQIMTRELALSLLRQGNTGEDLLNILETLTSSEEEYEEEIQF